MGLGATFPVFIISVQNAFDHSKVGVVTASIQFFRSIGSLFGVALFSAILFSLLGSAVASGNMPEPALLISGTAPPSQLEGLKGALSSSLSVVFIVATGLAFISLLAAGFLKEIPLRKSHAPPIQEAGIELAESEGTFTADKEPLRK